MLFARPTLILVFDRLSDTLFCVAPLWAPRDGEPGAADRQLERAAERSDEALRKLAGHAPAPQPDTSLPEIALGIPEKMRQLAPTIIPLGRPATPEDAAGPIFFLCTPWSNFVHGQVITASGGQTTGMTS